MARSWTSVLWLAVTVTISATGARAQEVVTLGGQGRTCNDDPGCINRLHPDIPMAARARPGQTIVLHTRNASDFDLDPASTYVDPRADGPAISTVHPLTGPVYIEGAAAEPDATADGHLKAAACRHTRNYLWAELMRRSLGLDVLACPRCGGRLTLIALIEDPAVIVRLLGHLGLPTDIPEAQPARAPPLHLVGDAPPTEVAGDQILFDEPA